MTRRRARNDVQRAARGQLRQWSAREDVLEPGLLGEVAGLLREGAVVLLPTESSYALACDPRRDRALQALAMLKGRDLSRKPLLLLAASLQQVRQVAVVDARAEAFAAAWPAALTLVLPAREPDLARRLGSEGIAIRVPAAPLARAACEALGAPLTGTSANRAGGSPILDAAMAEAFLEENAEHAGLVAGMVDAGRLPGGAPSTLLDLTSPEPRILRVGAFPLERLEAPGGGQGADA